MKARGRDKKEELRRQKLVYPVNFHFCELVRNLTNCVNCYPGGNDIEIFGIEAGDFKKGTVDRNVLDTRIGILRKPDTFEAGRISRSNL